MFQRLSSTFAALLIALAASGPVRALTVGFSPAVNNNAVAFSGPNSISFTSSFSTTARGGANLASVSMAYDQDGHLHILYPATGPLTGDGAFIETWDVANQALLSTFGRFHGGGVLSNMVLGPSGNFFVVNHSPSLNSNTINEYNALTPFNVEFPTAGAGRPLEDSGATGIVTGVAFDPDGHLNLLFAATALNGGFIERWDVTRQTLLGTSIRFQGGGDFSNLVLGPNGSLFFATHFASTGINRLSEYDPLTGTLLSSFQTTGGLPGAAGQVTGIAFDDNGNLNVGIDNGSGTSFIETWDFANQTLLGTSNQGVLNMSSLIADPIVVPEPNSAILCLGVAGWLGMCRRHWRHTIDNC